MDVIFNSSSIGGNTDETQFIHTTRVQKLFERLTDQQGKNKGVQLPKTHQAAKLRPITSPIARNTKTTMSALRTAA